MGVCGCVCSAPPAPATSNPFPLLALCVSPLLPPSVSVSVSGRENTSCVCNVTSKTGPSVRTAHFTLDIVALQSNQNEWTAS